MLPSGTPPTFLSTSTPFLQIITVGTPLIPAALPVLIPPSTDEEALEAYQIVTKFENLNPSLEPSHAFAEAIKLAPKLSKNTIMIVNSCGDAHKDKDILRQRLGKF